ncbi:hypothetical protein [Mesorhizobium sp. M7D.F.Ca.US.004.03.1.1]|uniref:hypothetical protein n=1 Tax=Mesorhizobium sp. M7D.F.Ca.US.004.03.1.1 TaxID=2496702 RepID=UPI001FDF998A|nr:hypothetical protein [Mesorhizobium sp. M7D.F.Ca.US.004.03.1.1]
MAACLAASDETTSPQTNVIAMAMITIVLRGEVDLETMPNNALRTGTSLEFFVALEAAKGPASLPAKLPGQRYQSVYGNRRVHHFLRA